MAAVYSYPKSRRLGGNLEFARVFEGKAKVSRGPLLVYWLANTLGHPRLGISISRRVGTAVRRNRIKRLLREVFRTSDWDLPRGYDLVIVVRPHEPLDLQGYEKLMSAVVAKIKTA